MQIKTENREVGRSGTSNERTFNIDMTAKAFKILSDGLYSDKILAVVRELSCNAKDSHIDAGKNDVPFEIHLPNSLEPWFAVTDYGLGLSPDDVLEMYSTYFASTKTGSNDVTGCLGLGSKSPFAYTDSFSVETRWNGTLTVFSCFYNEAGIPSIVILGDEDGMPTDEVNGVTVKMAVNDGDMREFAQKAMKALDRFDPAPIVTGNTDYEIVTKTYTVEGKGWKMLERESSYGESKIHAIQGNVTYPISSQSLGDLTSNQDAIMGLTVDLFFDIGELDVAANREALGYDEATIKNIKAKLDAVSTEIAPLFQDKFKDCKTLWDARLLFKEVINPLTSGLQRILSDNNVGLKWKKQSLSDSFKLDRDDFPNVQIVSFQKNTRGGRGQTAEWSYNGDIKFPASSDILFFYDDVGNGSHSRVTHFMETNGDSVRYQHMFKTDDKKMMKKISKALGNVTIQPVSNLEKRPKAVRQARRVTSKVLEYVGRAHDRRDSWNPTDLDLTTGGVYVMIDRFKVYDSNNGSGREREDFNTIVDLAKEHKIVDLTNKIVYGIRKGDVDKLKDDSGWVNLFDLIRDKLTVAVKKEKVAQVMADRYAYHQFSNDLSSFVNDMDDTDLAKDSVIGIFKRAHEYLSNRDSSKAQAISSVADSVGFTLKSAKPKHDLGKLWDAVKNKYPLLKLVSDSDLRGGYYNNRDNSISENNHAALTDYIAMVDAKDAVPEKRKILTLASAA